MKKILTAAAVAAMGIAIFSPAWAGDVHGKVKSIDPAGRVITLEDGTQLMVPPAMKASSKAVTPGAEVKASYDDKNGEKVLTAIEVQPAAK